MTGHTVVEVYTASYDASYLVLLTLRIILAKWGFFKSWNVCSLDTIVFLGFVIINWNSISYSAFFMLIANLKYIYIFGYWNIIILINSALYTYTYLLIHTWIHCASVFNRSLFVFTRGTWSQMFTFWRFVQSEPQFQFIWVVTLHLLQLFS